ncbi:MAG: aminoglycoside phosphotransferase family protein, partial [Caldilineaceae bacterium]|nr:aminoglycoside phosphotransferase family protein [Caldilineaceae bacterium]
MTDFDSAEGQPIDHTTLTPLVRQALHDDTATVADWTVEPLVGGFSGSAVHRFQGQAQTTRGRRSWSLVRKECTPANGALAPTAYDYWKRDVLLYQSGLLDTLPETLIAPHCFRIDEALDQTCWLWLEDMGAQEQNLQWPLKQYGIAARHLGHFNGAYLTGRPLPSYPWLRQPDVRERLRLAEAGIGELPVLRASPYFAPLLPDDHVERIQRLWTVRERLLARLDQLPQTFCHRDAFQRNLLMRQDDNGRPQTVVLDWGSCGLGILGEELVPLFAATLKFVFADATRLAELDQTIFTGYVAGLREAGWQGDERLVRFGFTALTALKDAVADPATKLPSVARRIAALSPGEEPP